MALGATLRWTGWLAAAGLEAIKAGFGYLEEDHRRAVQLADTCFALGLGPDPRTVESNIVLIETRRAGMSGGEFCCRAMEKGLMVALLGPDLVRLATSRKVDDRDIEVARAILRDIVG
jgi:threonine aldolase